jgi:hypothetical protein
VIGFVVDVEVVEEELEQDANTRDVTNREDSATRINPFFICPPFFKLLYILIDRIFWLLLMEFDTIIG